MKKIAKTIICTILSACMLVPMLGIVSSAEDTSYKLWKQFDSRWGSVQIAESSYQLNNVAQIGCAMTSLAMLLVHSGAVVNDVNQFNPGIFAEWIKSKGGFTPDGSIYWDVGASYARENGNGFKYVDQVDLSPLSQSEKIIKIRELLNKDYYVEVAVNNQGHWVAVDDVVGNSVRIMDPGHYFTDLFQSYSNEGTVRIVYYSGGTKSPKESYKNWKQNDPRWSSIVMGNADFDTSVGAVGSAATSLSMLIAKSGAVNADDTTAFNTAVFVNSVKEKGGFKDDGSMYWNIAGNYDGGFSYEGQVHLQGLSLEGKIAAVNNLTTQGYLVMVSVNNVTHWVAVDDSTIYSVSIMDPATEQPDLFNYYDSEGVKRLVYFRGPNTISNSDYLMISDCEDPEKWEASYDSTVEGCSDSVTQGENSLKITASDKNDNSQKISALASKKLEQPVNLSTYETVKFDVYLNKSISSMSTIKLELFSGTACAATVKTSLGELSEGWNTVESNIAYSAKNDAAFKTIDNVSFTWLNYHGDTGVYFLLDNISAARTSDYAVKLANQFIENLPDNITFADKNDVSEAKSLYDSLTENEKLLVSNYSKLESAVNLFILPEKDVFLINSCDTPSSWTSDFDSSVALGEEIFSEGNSSISVNPSQSNDNSQKISAKSVLTLSDKVDVSDYEVMLTDIYINRAVSNLGKLVVEISGNGVTVASAQVSLADLTEGWNVIKLDLTKADASALESIDSYSVVFKNFSGITDFNYCIDNIRTERNAQYAIDNMTNSISSLPKSVTSDDAEAVNTIKARFDRLTDSERVAVVNGDVLLAAVKKLEVLKKGLPGDVNGDGVADSNDALLILQSTVGKANIEESRKSFADVNYDSKTDSADALLILQYAVGKKDTL